MAEYVTIKKKLNVPVLIILLIFAIVPGIIYLIWSKIPTKICTDPEKGHGGMMRIIGAGITVVHWLLLLIVFFEAWPTFIIPMVPSIVMLAVAVLSKKNHGKLMLLLGLIVAIATLGISLWLFIYSFASIVGTIVMIVGCTKGIRHYNYHKLGKGKDDDEDDEDEDEE